MRKISVKDYSMEANGRQIPYGVKRSMITVLLHPSLQLGGRELLLRHEIGKKIEAATEFVLLEDSEFAQLESAFETVQGFSENDVKLVARVFDAEIISVKEA